MEHASQQQSPEVVPPVFVPWQSLQKETLIKLAQEAILREGFEEGSQEEMQRQIQVVLKGIERGKYLVAFDPSTESVGLIEKTQAPKGA